MSPSPTPAPSLISDSGKQALQHLISRAVPEGELISLIEKIFSSGKVSDIVGCLGGDDAQTFIDSMDEVRPHVSHLPEMG